MNRLDRALSNSKRKTLLGASVYFYDPIFLEIAGHLGYDVVWIEMEHAFITYAEAADLCRMAKAHDMLTMIRVPDTRRESILKAAECGPDIIDIPMVNTPEQISELLNYAKFPPAGERGFFSVSRSLRYGLVDSVSDEQQKLNSELSLIVQVETIGAVNRIEELCAIEGIAIFIGPADLSASLGVAGQLSHPKVEEAVRHIVATARRHNKRVATAVSQVNPFWASLDLDLIFCANDIVCLRAGAANALQQAEQLLAKQPALLSRDQ
jgi:2-keto-3-deoxy-L-rhamnonate aldolase RhmA